MTSARTTLVRCPHPRPDRFKHATYTFDLSSFLGSGHMGVCARSCRAMFALCLCPFGLIERSISRHRTADKAAWIIASARATWVSWRSDARTPRRLLLPSSSASQSEKSPLRSSTLDVAAHGKPLAHSPALLRGVSESERAGLKLRNSTFPLRPARGTTADKSA